MKGRIAVVLASLFLLVLLSTYFLFAPKPYKHTEKTPIMPIPLAEPPEEWKEYAPATQEFSVRIPTLPQHAADATPAQNTSGFVHYDIYFAQSRAGSTYVINVIEYPLTFDTTNPDVVLNGVMQEMLGGNPANQLMKSNRGNFSGYPSAEFALKNPDVEAYTRAILKGRSLYVLTVMDKDSQQAQANFTKFTDSFQFNSPEPSAIDPPQ